MDGIINVLKPPNMTSHDVVYYIRKLLKEKKVGHTGTLDPMAAGVLPICVGKATKISQFLLDETKKYRCEMSLGFNTDTQDRWGKIIKKSTVNVNEADIHRVFDSFKGKIFQIPPMYSAIKVNGKKLYELARKGLEIERKGRTIDIYQLDIVNIMNNNILFDVHCSKGTYIRTLCEDIGNMLECGGVMNFLLRTESGKFNLSNSCTLEELAYNITEEKRIDFFSIDYPIDHLPKINVKEDSGKYLLNGNNIFQKNIIEKDKFIKGNLVRLYLRDEFLALGEVKDDKNPYIDILRVFK